MIHIRIAFRKHTTSAVKSAPKSLTKTSETSMKSVPVRKDPSFTPISFSTARKQDFEIQSETWTPAEKRTGVLAVKKGMLSMWDKWGQHLPATVLQVISILISTLMIAFITCSLKILMFSVKGNRSLTCIEMVTMLKCDTI